MPAKVLAGDTTRSFIAATSPLVSVGQWSLLDLQYPIGLDVKVTLIPVAEGGYFSLADNGPDLGEEIFFRIGGTYHQSFVLR